MHRICESCVCVVSFSVYHTQLVTTPQIAPFTNQTRIALLPPKYEYERGDLHSLHLCCSTPPFPKHSPFVVVRVHTHFRTSPARHILPHASPPHALCILSPNQPHKSDTRSAAEELVRSQFNAFRNMPSPGIQLERTFGRQTRHGGSTQSLNRTSQPELGAVPLSGRNANSNTDLPTGPEQTTTSTVVTVATAPATTAVAADNVTTTTTAAQPRSKFAPGNMIKNFFK